MSLARLLALALVLGGATAQEPDAAADSSAEPESADLTLAEDRGEDERLWSFSASIYGYFFNDESNYGAVTVMADRDWLHLEARYNYEDIDTGSLWIGYNFEAGEEFTFALTPMLGGIFGNTDGVAPGYELTLGYKWMELYSEAEFVVDLNDSADDYFYSWSELTVSPTDWLYGGVAAQRTKIREEDSELLVGPVLGFVVEPFDFSFYLFDPGGEDETFATAFGISF